MIRKYLACGALLAFFTASAFGSTKTFTLTVNNGGLNYQAGTGGNFQLSKFDPSLGTLQSVLLSVTGYSIGGVNQIDNESATDAGTATLTIGSTVTVISGADSMTVVVLPSETVTGSVTTDTDVAPDFAGTDFLGISGSTSQDTKTKAPGDVTPYIGPGNITFNFTSSGNTGFNFDAPLDIMDFIGNPVGLNSANPRYYIEATVTYQYQDSPPQVPEPGTLGMAAVLGSLALARLRRSRRANR